MSEDIASSSGRLATFEQAQQATKRRASSTRKKTASTVTWPHATPTPEDLASAGFYFKPTSTSPDNVCCFLCKRQLDGWEPGDNPAFEHLTHSPDCGWAINQCIRLRNGDPDREEADPLSEHMIASRQATFGDFWPHEGKRGWRCKAAKMAEAGWVFDPAPDAEDGATCCYCGLSLDGWEPKDNPLEEHRKRASDCYFFQLCDDFAPTRPKKGKGSRSSRASRQSTQSNLTAFSDAPSLMSLGDDALPVDGDSVLTTATTASTASKTRKSRAKAAPRTTKKATRGRKNTVTTETSMLDESSINTSKMVLESEELPKPKKRSTKQVVHPAEQSALADSSIQDTTEEPVRKTTRTRQTKTKAKAGKSKIDDSQIQSDTLDNIEAIGPARNARGTKRTSNGFPKVGFTEPVTKTMEEQIPSDEPVPPRTKAKAKSKRAQQKDTTSQPRSSDATHLSMESTAEVKTNSKSTRERKPKEQKQDMSALQENKEQHPKPIALPTEEQIDDPIHEPIADSSDDVMEDVQDEIGVAVDAFPAPPPSERSRPLPELPEPTLVSPIRLEQEYPARGRDATPPQAASTPSPSPQPSDAENLPPSERPASMRPPLSAVKSPRAMPAPSTPSASPSKRNNNKLGVLKSSLAWDEIDLENIFVPSPSTERIHNQLFDKPSATGLRLDKEHFQRNMPLKDMIKTVREGLTSPEKKMSIEEWIYFNAKRGEERLRSECERMIGLFEAEGGKALRVLEGIECE